MNFAKLRRLFDVTLRKHLDEVELANHLIVDVIECLPRGRRRRDPATPKGQADKEVENHSRRALRVRKAIEGLDPEFQRFVRDGVHPVRTVASYSEVEAGLRRAGAARAEADAAAYVALSRRLKQ